MMWYTVFMDKKIQKFAFVGLGLIGGSLAKGIKKNYQNTKIIAYDTNENDLKKALTDGVIDEAKETIDESFKGCDFIFLCAPVSVNNDYLKALIPYLEEKTLITDVGSVKGPIVELATTLGIGGSFIGGHPMTGSEKSGFESAKEHLFENAYYILTPTAQTPADKLERYLTLLTRIRALPKVMEASEHDFITGTISHLPHVVAASLVHLVEDTDTKEQLMKEMAAGGFKDITRIASSSPAMWEQICLLNQENILKVMTRYIEELEKIKDLVREADGPALFQFFEEAKTYRSDLIDDKKGALAKHYVIYCDLSDEAGGIASIATALASQRINLKNIGIVHNREFEEGVLRIEFYDHDSRTAAYQVLIEMGYEVYER
ncbi:prephenate dehydrogenase [Lachnospiraceae bacterium PFB1-21]